MANISGTAGNDKIAGTSGDDNISTGKGNDLVYAGAGNDYVDGGSGDDDLYGGDGNDILYGGVGSDYLNGGSGDDILKGGGGGKDALFGGTGADQFFFRDGEGTASRDAVVFGGGHGYTTVDQWVIAADVSFAEGDSVRISGFQAIFTSLGLYSASQGVGIIDSTADVTALFNYFQSNPSIGKAWEITDNYYADGTYFVFDDGAGNQQALTLYNIHPDVVMV
jgi:Ca2+-binding RTX toxin-like protein